MYVLGEYIRDSGIKGAIVDTINGNLVTERHRIETPILTSCFLKPQFYQLRQ